MTNTPPTFVDLLQSKLSAEIEGAFARPDMVEIHVSVKKFFAIMQLLKLDSSFRFNMLLSVTAVDWLDARDNRFELVYHLLSIPFSRQIRIKVSLTEALPEIPSLCSIWSSANFMEREVYDMYGIRFADHPNLTRILMYEEFVGYPLRKDYPLQGKQPRIPLRHPEVENTANRMIRPDLITIRSRKRAA